MPNNIKPTGPLNHISIPSNLGLDGAYKKIFAEVIDTTDEVLYNAVVRMCKNMGVTDIYLMDEKFVFDALREKFEREYGRNLDIDDDLMRTKTNTQEFT